MRRQIALPLLLAVTLVVSGCLGATELGLGSASAEEIQQRSVEEMETVETLQFRMTMTMKQGDQTIELDSQGVVDQDAKRIRMETTMTMPAIGNLTARQYIIDDTQYIYTGQTGSWVKQETPGIWNRTQLANQRRAMGAVTVENNGTATVDGVETYVLDFNVTDTAAFTKAVSGSTTTGGSGGPDPLSSSQIDQYEGRMYIAKESKYLRKMVVQFSMTTDGQTMRSRIVMENSAIGKEVPIELPEAAKNAASAGA